MAIKDSILTLKGDQATAIRVEISRDSDGNYKIAVLGKTLTATSKEVMLEIGNEVVPVGNPTLDNIWSHALVVLRKANGLE